MYSSWVGSESEQRAVFVDEVKCVGCLKCALLADKTFAIESVYGRARVVAQWADPEHKIQQSIDACPVNCISMVERSDLAALEFLMSKLPRGNVRVGSGNTAGTRFFDVFSELKVFHKQLQQAMDQKSQQNSKYSRMQTEARMSAIQAIRSFSNWLYWHSPASETCSNLSYKEGNRSPNDSMSKLKEAVARGHNILNTRKNPGLLPQATAKDEYWVPSTSFQPSEPKDEPKPHTRIRVQTPSPSPEDSSKGVSERSNILQENYRRSPFASGVPIGIAVFAAAYVRLYGAGQVGGRVEQHIAGSLALDIVNSPWLPVALAGVTWYILGVTLVQLIESLGNESKLK